MFVFLKTAGGELIRANFIVKIRNQIVTSKLNLQILIMNLIFIYGIVVCNSNAAYFENNGSITELLVFKAFTIL
jgi:hypothetical protein